MTLRQRTIAVNLGLGVSFAYFLLLVPHFPAIHPDHFKAGWFFAGMVVAFLWMPIIALRRHLIEESGTTWIALAFVPLILEAAYIGTLLAAAG